METNNGKGWGTGFSGAGSGGAGAGCTHGVSTGPMGVFNSHDLHSLHGLPDETVVLPAECGGGGQTLPRPPPKPGGLNFWRGMRVSTAGCKTSTSKICPECLCILLWCGMRWGLPRAPPKKAAGCLDSPSMRIKIPQGARRLTQCDRSLQQRG